MAWADIPTWIKFLLALGVTAGGIYLLVKVDISLGIIVLFLAAALLIISGRDGSDRRGYKF